MINNPSNNPGAVVLNDHWIPWIIHSFLSPLLNGGKAHFRKLDSWGKMSIFQKMGGKMPNLKFQGGVSQFLPLKYIFFNYFPSSILVMEKKSHHGPSCCLLPENITIPLLNVYNSAFDVNWWQNGENKEEIATIPSNGEKCAVV